MMCQEQSQLEPSPILEVWTQDDWPPEGHPTAPGFKVSPYNAFRNVAKSKRLSFKHKWGCFRDDKFYYVADTFAKTINASNVKQYAVKIDGTTGEIK